MSDPIEGIDKAIAAAEHARERMRTPGDISPPCAAAAIVSPVMAALERAHRSSAAPAKAPAADLDAARAARLEAVCASVIPAGRRTWARFDHPLLAARVASKTAIAATRAAVGASAVVWTGGSGRGKTSLACAALRARIEAGCKRPVFVGAWRLAVARARHPLGAGEPDIVEQALRAELLVLDELGDQHGPTSAVPDVIYERESEGLDTWVTTYMTNIEVAKLLGDGIARRIFERAVIIDCGLG